MVKVAVETTSLPVSWQVARTSLIAAVTSIALASVLSGGIEQGDVAGTRRDAGDRDMRCAPRKCRPRYQR